MHAFRPPSDSDLFKLQQFVYYELFVDIRVNKKVEIVQLVIITLLVTMVSGTRLHAKIDSWLLHIWFCTHGDT